MAENRNQPSSTTTFTDHEVIVVPNRLRKAVRRARAGAAERDPVLAADEALEQLSAEFENWMVDECEQLDRARKRLRAEGVTEGARESLFRAAHDIKGHAATFGFPTAAEVAESLCRLIEQAPDLRSVPLTFIDQCVDAIRAIIRERDLVDAHRTATALAEGLRALADDLIGSGGGGGSDDGAPPVAPP
jgi:HPt (histidine-containing phosphotransfer) domain-containing protein